MNQVGLLLPGLCLFAGTLTPVLTAATKPDRPVPVGLKKQLFVDDYVVKKQGVVRELGKVTKAGGGKLVLVADRP